MLFQLLRIGTVLFLVSVTVAVLMDVKLEYVIILGGLFILLYTVFGGIEVVIWTDVVQTIVLWGGALVMFGFIAAEMPDGLLAGLDRAHDAGKFSLGEFEWDMGRRTFWTLLAIGAFDAVANNASNQTVVQRYIAARSTREARKAVWISLLLSLPTWTFFYLVGTALSALYNALPDPALAQMLPEEVVPYFTRHYVPVGLTGLIVAAIMAASMSSMDSSINAISTIATTDVIRRYTAPDASEKTYLLYAKIISAVAGAAMIGIALGIANLEMESVVDLTRQIASIFGGVVAGIFLLAIFVPRVGAKALLMALPVAVGVKLYYGMGLAGWIPESWRIPVHTYWIGVVSNVVLMVLAYALSFVWPRTGQRRRDGGLGIGIVKTSRRSGAPPPPPPPSAPTPPTPPTHDSLSLRSRPRRPGRRRHPAAGDALRRRRPRRPRRPRPARGARGRRRRPRPVRAGHHRRGSGAGGGPAGRGGPGRGGGGRGPVPAAGRHHRRLHGQCHPRGRRGGRGRRRRAGPRPAAVQPGGRARAQPLPRRGGRAGEPPAVPLRHPLADRRRADGLAPPRDAARGLRGLQRQQRRMVVLHEVIHRRDRERPGFRVLVGPEELLGEAVLLGADGGVAGGANLFPRLFVALYEAARTGDLPTLRRLHAAVIEVSTTLYRAGLHGSSFIKAVKGGLDALGVCEDHLVLPYERFRGEDRGRLRGLFEEASTVVDRALAGEPS